MGGVSAENSGICIHHAFHMNQPNATELVLPEIGETQSQYLSCHRGNKPLNSPLIHFLSPFLKPHFILLPASPRTSSLQNPLWANEVMRPSLILTYDPRKRIKARKRFWYVHDDGRGYMSFVVSHSYPPFGRPHQLKQGDFSDCTSSTPGLSSIVDGALKWWDYAGQRVQVQPSFHLTTQSNGLSALKTLLKRCTALHDGESQHLQEVIQHVVVSPWCSRAEPLVGAPDAIRWGADAGCFDEHCEWEWLTCCWVWLHRLACLTVYIRHIYGQLTIHHNLFLDNILQLQQSLPPSMSDPSMITTPSTTTRWLCTLLCITHFTSHHHNQTRIVSRLWSPQGRKSTIFSRCKIRNTIEAGGAQCPWGCIDDWWKSVLGFWDGEGGLGHTVGEDLEEHMKGGGWEGTVLERQGEGVADEKVAWWGGWRVRQGKSLRFGRKWAAVFNLVV